MVHLGIVSYINALPFYLPFKLGVLKTTHTFEYGIPTILNDYLRTEKIEAALTSSIEYLQGSYQLAPDLCIATYQESLSVNLYLRGKLEGGSIGLTHQSATSVILLKILCRHFWNVTPQFFPLIKGKSYDGILMIGDDALKRLTIPHHKTIDLATAWYQMTGLPFVFAVIAIRKGVLFDSKELRQALEWSKIHRQHLVEVAYHQTQLPKLLINHYYDSFHYQLKERELEGLDLFKKLKEDVS
ncbi:MAG: menaquinone biosynthesis protein [Chlamydiales bacterium]